MKPKVAIIDYGLGNLFSINNACEFVGLDSLITSDKKIISEADAVILPGVGAFGDAMNCLESEGLTKSILDFIDTGRPFMGICLGMQLLFSESEEFGINKGLNLIEGSIRRFPSHTPDNKIVRVPQIQWNQIYKNNSDLWEKSPLKTLENGDFMHFVHSYYAIPEDPTTTLSFSFYEGLKYTSAVQKENITGFQYHPEKSGVSGIAVYQNWANYISNKIY